MPNSIGRQRRATYPSTSAAQPIADSLPSSTRESTLLNSLLWPDDVGTNLLTLSSVRLHLRSRHKVTSTETRVFGVNAQTSLMNVSRISNLASDGQRRVARIYASVICELPPLPSLVTLTTLPKNDFVALASKTWRFRLDRW